MAFDSKEVEFADQAVFVNGVEIAKLTDFQFTTAKEKEEIYGAGDDPQGIQGGNRSYNGTATLYKGVIDNLNRAAIVAGGKDMLDANYVVVITYRAKGQRLLQTHTCIGLEFLNWGAGMAQNEKSQSKVMPFKFIQLIST